MRTSDSSNYYLYRHARLDTNEVFYIGIGKKPGRATSKQYRNKHWLSIIAKAEYSVEILFDGMTCEKACEKEKEFIKMYGRRDLGTGTLVNMTDGGIGQFGSIVKKETIKKLSKASKGNTNRKGCKLSEETLQKMSAAAKGNTHWLGKTHTEESKIKIGKASKGRVGYWNGKNHSQQSKNKISDANIGRIRSEEVKKKHSERMKGSGNPIYGKPRSEETKRKISETKKMKKILCERTEVSLGKAFMTFACRHTEHWTTCTD